MAVLRDLIHKSQNLTVTQVNEKIIRSGIAHSVETSQVTKNAVNPRNTFIDVDAPIQEESPSPNANAQPERALVDFEKSPDSSKKNLGKSNYPVLKESFNTRDKLSTVKSHIQENIQALHKLAHSENRQSMGADRFTDNMQDTGPVEHIKDHIVYLGKKSIKDNFQKISKSAPRNLPQTLSTKPENKPLPENNKKPSQNMTASELTKNSEDEDALTIRLKQIKAKVKTVNNSLTEFEDKENPES